MIQCVHSRSQLIDFEFCQVAVLVPKERLYDAFGDSVFEHFGGSTDLINFVCQQAIDLPHDSTLTDSAWTLLRRVVTEANGPKYTSPALLVKTIEWSFAIGFHECFSEALRASFKNDACHPKVLDAIVGLICQYHGAAPAHCNWNTWYSIHTHKRERG